MGHESGERAKGTAGRPQALSNGGGGSNTSPETTVPKSEEGEEKEEGTFDLVFSQLELLRLLQVVMR